MTNMDAGGDGEQTMAAVVAAATAAAAAAAVRFLLFRVLLALAMESPLPDWDLPGVVVVVCIIGRWTECGREVFGIWAHNCEIGNKASEKSIIIEQKYVREERNRFVGEEKSVFWGFCGNSLRLVHDTDDTNEPKYVMHF